MRAKNCTYNSDKTYVDNFQKCTIEFFTYSSILFTMYKSYFIENI